MSSQNLVRQFLRAVLHELYRSKAVYNVIASLVLGVVIVMGYTWREYYVSQAVISTSRSQELVAIADYSDIRAKRLTNLAVSDGFLANLSFSVEEQLADERIEGLKQNFSADQLSNDTVNLSYRSSTPEQAQAVLRLAVDLLMAELVPQEEIEHVKEVLAQITLQEKEKKAALDELEALLTTKQGSNSGQSAIRTQERVLSLRESIQDVNVELNVVASKITRIESELNKEEKIQADKRSLEQLRSQKSKLVDDINAKIETYGEFAPEVISVQQELDAVNAQIYELTENTVLYSEEQESNSLYENLRKQLTLETLEREELQSRKSSLKRLLKEAEAKASVSESKAKQNLRKQKEYKIMLADFDDLLTRKERNQTKLKQLQGNANDYQVAQAPDLPRQYSGVGFIEIIILGPIFSLFLPCILAVLIVLFDSRIRTSRQLKKGLPDGLVIMATIPHYDSPQASRVFRRALMGMAIWAALVFSAYFALGYIGLKNW